MPRIEPHFKDAAAFVAESKQVSSQLLLVVTMEREVFMMSVQTVAFERRPGLRNNSVQRRNVVGSQKLIEVVLQHARLSRTNAALDVSMVGLHFASTFE